MTPMTITRLILIVMALVVLVVVVRTWLRLRR